MNCVKDQVEIIIIAKQAGFRPVKACKGQIPYLRQHFKDGFEQKKVTRVVFVDLMAAYDTVNHNLLLKEV